MDSILSEFIQRTRADPALAQDLLEATEWNLDMAISFFDNLQETKVVEPQEYVYDPKDFESIRAFSPETIPEEAVDSDKMTQDPDVLAGSNLDENEAKRREVLKRKKMKRSRGLSFEDAEEVIDKFSKVAVVKQRVSTQEQIIIDEKFFHHSFVYPDISSEEIEVQEYISSDLLEISHKKALERSGRLNWWTNAGRLPQLEPLATSGDGNCLLHAASLYMWGLHDNSLILRTALHRLLTSGVEQDGIKRRWKYQTQLRNNEAGGLTFTEEEWEFEWGEILRIATNKPRRQPMTDSLRRHSSLRMSYESLEEIHISVLAHTLRRPIVVISDSTIKDMAGQDLAPIYFGGIYLPLEVNPTACHKSPVVLAYDSSHFSPLVSTQNLKSVKQQPRAKYARTSSRVETVIPLVSPNGALLPIQFVYDPKKKDGLEKWAEMKYEVGEFPEELIRLLESYLNVRWIQLKVSSDERMSEDYDHNFPIQVPKVRFPAASIAQEAQPIYQKELIEKYLKHIRIRFQEEKEAKARRIAEREEEERKRLMNRVVPCEGKGCEMFGRPATNNLCSVCYQKSLRSPKKQKSVSPSPDFIPPNEEPDVAGIHKTTRHQQESKDFHHPDTHRVIEQGQSSNSTNDRRPMPSSFARDLPSYSGTKPAKNSDTTVSKQPLAPLSDASLNQRHSDSPQHNVKQPLVSPSHAAKVSRVPSGQAPKQPLMPPGEAAKQLSGSVAKSNPLTSKSRSPTPPPPYSRTSQAPPTHLRSRTPDENIPKSRSPTPPAPPPKPSPARSKSPQPQPSKAASSHTPSGSKSAPPPNSRSLVPSLFKKTSSPTHNRSQNKGGKYSRDNILPLHLESASSVTDPSKVDETTARRNCITSGCEFYGSSGCIGYCSSCYKRLVDSTSTV